LYEKEFSFFKCFVADLDDGYGLYGYIMQTN